MLDSFIKAKKKELHWLQSRNEAGLLPNVASRRDRGFASALQAHPGVCVIAEYKRGSPSKGVINKELSPQEAGSIFFRSGAAAVSVLTEREHFLGSFEFLHSMQGQGLALLRKDFLFHPLQIRHTASSPAAAVLLIMGLLHRTGAELSELIPCCLDYGLEPVVEITSSRELDAAKTAGARVIQVNNRDLSTLRVDDTVSREVVRDREEGEIWISASGIQGSEQVTLLGEWGYDACLVGTSLMQNPDPEGFLAHLVRAGRKGGGN